MSSSARPFVFWMIAVLAACSGAAPAPAWYPPQACRDCYQGEGVGPDYQAALGRARKMLCDDILVVVESETTDDRKHLLHQAQDGEGEKSEEMDYSEVVRMVSKSRSKCAFDNMPLHEQREDVGGQSFVVLRMGISDYARYLAGRTVQVQVSSQTDGVNSDAAVEAVTDRLRGQGYLVVTHGTSAKYLGLLNVSVSMQNAGAQFSGMAIASGEADWVLVRSSDGAEIERVHAADITARGFKEKSVLNDFGVAIGEALKKKWENK